MNKWIYLSYPLSIKTPAYGDENGFKFQWGKSIEKGDSCNTQYWYLPNHLGTHIDFPKHFVRDGKTARDYPAEFWVFHSPFMVDISPVAHGSIIQLENIPFMRVPENTDLLIVKTGFFLLRGENVYHKDNPGFAPGLAVFLREHFPRLRVLGFDSISLSSFTHRETGRKAHRAFLDHPRPILLLEDMDLSMVNNSLKIKKIIVSPLRVEGADAAPCNVFADIVE
jgi:arylformamidase